MNNIKSSQTLYSSPKYLAKKEGEDLEYECTGKTYARTSFKIYLHKPLIPVTLRQRTKQQDLLDGV